MTFADTAALAADGEFRARLGACLTTEALGKTGDPLADLIIKNQSFWGIALFADTVAAAPGFGDKYAAGGQSAISDGDMLSAVQADWDRIAALHTEEAPA